MRWTTALFNSYAHLGNTLLWQRISLLYIWKFASKKKGIFEKNLLKYLETRISAAFFRTTFISNPYDSIVLLKTGIYIRNISPRGFIDQLTFIGDLLTLYFFFRIKFFILYKKLYKPPI